MSISFSLPWTRYGKWNLGKVKKIKEGKNEITLEWPRYRWAVSHLSHVIPPKQLCCKMIIKPPLLSPLRTHVVRSAKTRRWWSRARYSVAPRGTAAGEKWESNGFWKAAKWEEKREIFVGYYRKQNEGPQGHGNDALCFVKTHFTVWPRLEFILCLGLILCLPPCEKGFLVFSLRS